MANDSKKFSLAEKLPIKISLFSVTFKNSFNKTVYKNSDNKKEAQNGRQQEQNLL